MSSAQVFRLNALHAMCVFVQTWLIAFDNLSSRMNRDILTPVKTLPEIKKSIRLP